MAIQGPRPAPESPPDKTLPDESLERRYLRLLRAYPEPYRRARAAEMLGTLLEMARPGQRRPTIRETIALALGGLRARVGANQRRTATEAWLGGLAMAVLLVLAGDAAIHAQNLVLAGHALPAPGAGPAAIVELAAVLLSAAAFVAVLLRRYAWGIALIVATLAASVYALDDQLRHEPLGRFALNYLGTSRHSWLLPALFFTVPLLRWRPPALPLRWQLAVPLGLFAVPNLIGLAFPPALPWSLLVALLGCLLWTAVDARVPAALGGFLLAWLLPVAFTAAFWADGLRLWLTLAVAGLILAATLALGAVRAGRQASL